MPRRRTAILAATAAVALAVPAVAEGAVLVHSPSTRPACGDPIQVGIFAQPGTTGNRTVRISAYDRATKTVWWHRTATAPVGRFRSWILPSGRLGRCGTTTIVYRGFREDGSRFTSRFTVRFHGEGV